MSKALLTPGFRPFEHLNTPKHALYRRIMHVFTEHKRRFVVHLRPEDVADALRAEGPVSTEEVEAALEALAGWGNLRSDPDTSRVGTVEDFYRRRQLFQLTREGEAAERALEVYEAETVRRGELQAVALEDIRLRLKALRSLAGETDPDPAVVHSVLLELTGRLDSLAANASAFMGGLQRTIDLQELDEEAFFAYKDRLIAYLERFVSELVQKAYDIRQTLGALAPERVTALLSLAAHREAADAAPDGENGEAGPAAARLGEWQDRWRGIEAWFAGDRLHPSQCELLRRRASKAIPDLLAAIRLLQERRSGRSDRSADFRTLALWFAQAHGDEEAHRLWRAAFGLGTARHLTGQSADLEAAPVPAGTSWLDAPPVEVAARLRATGRYTKRGAPSKVADRSASRDLLAAQIAAERAQTEAARRRLATGRPVRLSNLGEIGGAGEIGESGGETGLDKEELALFLRLLGEALAAGPPGPDGRIVTMTADGAYEVTLSPVLGGPVVALQTREGVMYGPDHEITIVDRTVPPPLPLSSSTSQAASAATADREALPVEAPR
ncbi:MAG: TIGR02677 family protein [Streptomycetaceae bacterium]|nr:TIGR02677 family protein [Streptomycetaceae bacterium]